MKGRCHATYSARYHIPASSTAGIPITQYGVTSHSDGAAEDGEVEEEPSGE